MTANLLEDVECIHGLDSAWCQLCRTAAGVVRRADGDHFRSDCTVRAFVAITGADYHEAADYMRAAGFRPGKGASASHAAKAFAAAGFRMVQTGLDLEQAVKLSRAGRCFYVSAQTRSKGHAWAVVDGEQPGGWTGRSYRYRIAEVVA